MLVQEAAADSKLIALPDERPRFRDALFKPLVRCSHLLSGCRGS
ncbi:hypothetical protein ACEPPZ_19855 [Paracoccus yeei]|nr:MULTISPECIES: hypothetical protein [unclassified Paracoccus (in: a-proteobacteria)]